MRPNLTVIIIILAVLFSLAAGLVLGGGLTPWFGGNEPATGNPNADIPVGPPTVTPVTPQPVSQLVATSEARTLVPATLAATATLPSTPTPTPTIPPTATATPPPTATLAPTELPAPTGEAVAVTGVQLIADASVRLRTAPANDSTVIGMLNGGQTVSVVGRTTDWAWAYVVLESSALQGWVTADAEFVTLEGDVDAVPVLD